MADGVGSAGLAGAGAGALKGGMIGANPLLMGATGGLSAPIGAGVGAIIGGINSSNKKRDANTALNNLQAEDPEERAMQRYFARRKRAYATGTANNLDRSALRQGLQAGVNNAFKYGAPTRGISALNQIYQQGLMGLNAQGIQASNTYGAQEVDIKKNMIQRRLELGLLKYSQKSAESAQRTTEDKQNTGVGLAKEFDEMRKARFKPTQDQITMITPTASSGITSVINGIGGEIDPSTITNLTGALAGGF